METPGSLGFKGLSHCHEFGYDMRQVKNSRHVIGKSKRCRHISYIVGSAY